MSQEHRGRPISMKLVVSLTVVSLIAVTLGAVYWLTEHNVRRALQQEMETRLLLEARHLALLSTDALLSDYPELTLCPIVREMLAQRPDLKLAAILNHDGTIKGHPDVRQLGQPLSLFDQLEPYPTLAGLQSGEAMIATDDLLAAHVPARHPGGQLLGTVLVAQDRHHLDSILARNRLQVALLAAGLALAGVIIAVLLVRRLLSPLDNIRDGLNRIGQGDLQTPILLRNRTELGSLADSIDDMASKLKSSQDEAQAKEREVIATQSEVIHTLGEVVESRSQETGGHIDRVAEGAALLAGIAGLRTGLCDLLRMAAPMHDVGKIAIPDDILHKPGELTVAEFKIMETHTTVGEQILSQSERPIFKAAAIIAAQHHERWDGHGYPRGLKGKDIHPFGRIVAIVDVFDALTSDRCYRPAMSLEKALDVLHEGRGTQFDPELLDHFLAHLGEFVAFIEKRSGTPAATGLTACPVEICPDNTPELETIGV